jgi:Domain of unknown function (DUF4105)
VEEHCLACDYRDQHEAGNDVDDSVYLYRLDTSADDARRLLMVYLERMNELADRAEFYHLLSNSCTINIIRYANAAGRVGRFEIRHLLNGLLVVATSGIQIANGFFNTFIALRVAIEEFDAPWPGSCSAAILPGHGRRIFLRTDH